MPGILTRIYQRGYAGLNYRLRTVAGGRFATFCRPVSIGFVITERCNARCLHCDIWKNRGKEERVEPEAWRRVLTDLRRWLGPVHVFFSGGEALLYPHTVDLVSHAVSAGLFVEVLTHGYWPDQRRIEALAMARPWRITVSLDAIGPVHSKIRGRDDFYERTSATLKTLLALRRERRLPYEIRLKAVIMDHNLDEVAGVAEFATQDGVHVFFQPVEQNYNTPEDRRWFLHSANWPQDIDKAVSVVESLIGLKREGRHIDNSFAQLEAMISYFRDPERLRLATQAHSAHERRPSCSALTNLQFQPNGDVLTCYSKPPAGNIRNAGVREIWDNRTRWWESGCCLDQERMQ